MKKEKNKMAKSSVKLKPTAPTFDFDVKGQDHVFETILPYIELYHSGLSFEGRPVGVFLLLGHVKENANQLAAYIGQY